MWKDKIKTVEAATFFPRQQRYPKEKWRISLLTQQLENPCSANINIGRIALKGIKEKHILPHQCPPIPVRNSSLCGREDYQGRDQLSSCAVTMLCRWPGGAEMTFALWRMGETWPKYVKNDSVQSHLFQWWCWIAELQSSSEGNDPTHPKVSCPEGEERLRKHWEEPQNCKIGYSSANSVFSQIL